MVGLASLHSRAGVRWVAALITAASFILVVGWAYSNDAQLYIVKGAAADFGRFSLAGGGKQPYADRPPQSVSDDRDRQPRWMLTPAPFDTSELPEYDIFAAKIAMSPALDHDIARAMERFLKRPMLSHEVAIMQNEAACPREQLERQVNSDQLRGDQEKWLAVDELEIEEMRRSALNFLEAKSEEEGGDALIGPGIGTYGKPVQRGSRGVVIAAGNHRTVERAVICIKEMQKLGWRGGIEVWHFDGELQDEKDLKMLKDLGVEIHVVSTKKKPDQWKNFELKAEAILRSSFDEVLYLDSDNFPLSDITTLFDAPLFTDPRGGQAVFWPDLNRDHPDNAIHRVLGIPCHDAWELDSGQILIAKSGNDGLNLAALYLAEHMQTEAGYWFSGGDKDTFRYAFLVLGIPYTPAPRWLALLGNNIRKGGEDLFCGAAMLQYGISPPRPEHADPSDPAHPEPLFIHANLLKHMAGFRQGEVFSHMRRLSLAQDDVRLLYGDGEVRPLDSIAGGAREILGRGLCSDIWSFGDSTTVETVDTKDAFGGLMAGFEQVYVGKSGRLGAWK